MTPPLGRQPRQRRSSVRHQARLDVETSAKLEELASNFHRKRSATLRYVMQWGLHHSTGWTLDRSPVVAVPPVPVLLAPELLQQVQDAAEAHGASVAAWLRHGVRHVRISDFPPSWQVAETTGRSHDSPLHSQRFMLRLDADTQTKLQALTQAFDRSAAEVIRQFIAQATLEDFPQSWQMAAMERRPPEARPPEARPGDG
jgi:predicted transcriptional regulator